MKRTALTLIAMLAPYPAFVFVTWELWPSQWDEGARLACLVFSLALASYGWFYQENDDF